MKSDTNDADTNVHISPNARLEQIKLQKYKYTPCPKKHVTTFLPRDAL